MNENWAIAIFIVVGGWLLGLSIVLVGGIITFNQRLTRLETVFEIAGGKAFEALHRDDDKHSLDGLIEKYQSGNDDLPMQDWIKVKEICSRLSSDTSKGLDERIGLGLAAAFAVHKLMRYGKSIKELKSADLEPTKS